MLNLSVLSRIVNNTQSRIPRDELLDYPVAFVDASYFFEQASLEKALEEALDPSNDASEEALRAAIIPEEIRNQVLVELSFAEGFPTIVGKYVWDQLPCESNEHYRLFETYVQLPDTLNFRSLSEVARCTSTPHETLYQLFYLNHWFIRAEAYDRFNHMVEEQELTGLIKNSNISHREQADILTASCMDWFKEHIDELSHKDALEWFKIGTQLKRLTMGLDPTKADATQKIQIQGDEDKPLEIVTRWGTPEQHEAALLNASEA